MDKIFLFIFACFTLSAAALDVRYCVDANSSERPLRATIWAFLLKGDTLQSVKDEKTGENCVALSTSEEKDKIIAGVVAQRHPQAVRHTQPMAARGPQAAAKDGVVIPVACRLLLQSGSEKKYVYLTQAQWKKIEFEECDLEMLCTPGSDHHAVRIKVGPGTAKPLDGVLKSGSPWSLNSGDLSACAGLKAGLSVGAR